MNEEVTRVEYRPPYIIVHKKEIIELDEVDLSLPQFEWLRERGFVKVYPEAYGYALGKDRRGRWFRIDLREKKIEWEIPRPKVRDELKTFILSKAIPESEWGPWVKRIRVIGENRL